MAPRIIRKNKQEGRESVRNETASRPKYKTLPEIPQDQLDISTSTNQFNFPTFQEMTDWMVTPGDFINTYDNPYYAMWMEENAKGPEADSAKVANLEKQAIIYGQEAEKNFKENLKYYNENEQPAALNWLGENLDAFDLATAPISTGLAPAKVLAKMGPLARVGAEAALQAGLEGGHSALEGEDVALGAVTGGLAGLVPGAAPALWNEASINLKKAIPSIKLKEKQAMRREILKQAEPLMKGDKQLEKTVKSRLNRMKDGPLMTEADELAFIDRNMPYNGGYFLGDIRDPRGIMTQKGFESDLLDRIMSHGSMLEQTGNFPKGELKSFFPSQSTGESPLYGKILDMLPERFDEWGNRIYNYDDVMNALRKWNPSNASEDYLKTMLINDYAFGPSVKAPASVERGGNITTLMAPRDKMFEEYPGLGLAGLQGLYNAPSDVLREGFKDMKEGAEDEVEGLKGLYNFGSQAAKNPEKFFDEAVSRAFKREME